MDHSPVPPNSRVTSYDVARRAGVSQSAVSRAFRSGASISPDLRARVEAAADALGYAPSNIARTLNTQRSQTIGVVITEMTTRNYPDILFHLGREIQASGNRMLVFTLPEDTVSAAVIADLHACHVDGVISGATIPTDLLEATRRRHLPVVLYNRVPRGARVAAVGCDHATGMQDLAEHLARSGTKDVAFLAGPEGAPVSDDRLRASRAALAEHGIALRAPVHADYSFAGGRAATRDLIAGRRRPDTILCANDAMALGVMDALRYDIGLSVPGDVAVAGFDDIEQSAWPSYGLTSVAQPVARMTRAAVRMLVEHVEGENLASERRLMPATLIVRNSTRPADK